MSDYTISEAIYRLSQMVKAEPREVEQRLGNYLFTEINDLATEIPQRDSGNYPNIDNARKKFRISESRLRVLSTILFPEDNDLSNERQDLDKPKDTRPPASQFLDTVKAASGLRLDERLYSVLGLFRGNLQYRYCSSTDIFRAAYGDPEGTEYWRGWFDKPGLTVEEFARLLATQVAAEYADAHAPGKDIPSMVKYETSRESLILALKEAAEMKLFPFVGDVDALLHMKVGSGPQMGWVWQGGKIKSLSQVKVYPRETLRWFADCPERAVLLPESIRLWWDAQGVALRKGEQDRPSAQAFPEGRKTVWDLKTEFTLEEASYLWFGYCPGERDIPQEEKKKITDLWGVLQEKWAAGEIEQIVTPDFLNALLMDATKGKVSPENISNGISGLGPPKTTRESLKTLAESIGQKPFFLFPEERKTFHGPLNMNKSQDNKSATSQSLQEMTTKIREADERKYPKLDLYELARLVRGFLIPYPFVQAVYLCPGTEQDMPYKVLFKVTGVPKEMEGLHKRFMGDIWDPPERHLALQRVYRDQNSASIYEWTWYDVEDEKNIEGEGLYDFVLSGESVCLCARDAVGDIKKFENKALLKKVDQLPDASRPQEIGAKEIESENKSGKKEHWVHSPDFRSIYKDGKEYTLTSKQAHIFEMLWEAQATRTPALGQDYILEEVSPNTSTRRLKEIFKRNPEAWKSLIEPGDRKGTFRLKK